ncbi:MAG: protein-tyrosine phosphatase family protein [Candidatus Rifleibacteriota bacterium]
MQPEEKLKTYWLIDRKILAGPYPYNPGADKPLAFLHYLISLGINSFVDLTEEDELTHYTKYLSDISANHVDYKRFPVEDYSVPSFATMNEIIAYLNKELAANKLVYLHCFGGIGRTGTVAACFLLAGNLAGLPEEALKLLSEKFANSVNSKWTSSPETDEQKKFVFNWYERWKQKI